MDGVLCDYMKSYNYVKERYGLEFPQSKEGFFENLEPIQEAVDVFNRFKEHSNIELYILTRPSVKNLNCYTEKAIWIKKYLGEDVLENMILACDKSLLIGDFLIDDDHRHGQPNFMGKHIYYGVEYNNWDDIYNYIVKSINK